MDGTEAYGDIVEIPQEDELGSVLSEDLLKKLPKPSANSTMFYRGHSKAGWSLQPSLFRQRKYHQNEDKMIREVLAAYPADFAGDGTCIERLARAQHYGLPTRILDITTNVLSAMFFCCIENEKFDAELICINVNNNRVKTFDSDSVSCAANLSHLTFKEEANIRDYILKEINNGTPAAAISTAALNRMKEMGKLHHYICSEKPYFLKKIKAIDISLVKAVLPRLTNRRLHAQSGAFLLFGLQYVFKDDSSQHISVHRMKIPASGKKKIIEQLDSVGINSKFLFPEIEKGCEYIRRRVENL